MRIVSLLPAATEIVHALGLDDELVGIDAASDRASETGGPAVVTDGSGLLDDALQSARPDLVLVGGDDPDAPDAPAEERLRLLVPGATVMRLAPVSIEGVFHAVTSVGAMAEAEDEAVGLVELLRERLLAVEERVEARRVAGRQPRRVVLLDGLAPPRVAGRWVPEQIRRAGGWDVLGREGQRSAYVDWDAVADVDPEVIVVAPAGTRLGGALRAWRRLAVPTWFDDLEAARADAVFALDAAYVERGGPRVVDGMAALAEILDPHGFVEVAPAASWARLRRDAR